MSPQKSLCKLGLSLFVVYHLVVVVVLGNPDSIYTRSLYPVISGYANMLNLNTAWRFFAPNPGWERYVEYEVLTEEEFESESLDLPEDIKIYTWPPSDRSPFLRENFNRRFYHSILTVGNERQISEYLVPFLCRKHKEAYAITISIVAYEIPNMDKARVLGRPVDKVTKERDTITAEYQCDRGEL